MMRRQFAPLLVFLFPVRWDMLGKALLCNAFPMAAVVYMVIWSTSSMPWVTRFLFIVLLIMSASATALQNFRNIRLSYLDNAMCAFFCLALVGYFRSDHAGSIVSFFLAFNLTAYLVGRSARLERSTSFIAYFFAIALIVAVGCLASLPEIYHQWNVVGPKHPLLFGVIGTANGLDVTLGCLPVIAGVLLITGSAGRDKKIVRIQLACVATGMALLILIASKSVIVSTIMTLCLTSVFHYRRWRMYVPMLGALLSGIVIAVLIAPANNHAYYGLNSVDHWMQAVYSVAADESETASHSIDADTGVHRIRIATAAFQAIAANPWLGVGPRAWTYDAPHPHNVLIEAALIFGVPAALLLLFFFITSIWRLIQSHLGPHTQMQANHIVIASLLLSSLLYNLVQGQLAAIRSLPLFLLSGYASALLSQCNQAAPADTSPGH